VSNERFLVISYFVVLLASLGIGLAAYLALRRPFRAVCDTSGSAMVRLIRRFFLVGIVGPAFLGFCSVSYFSCNVTTYDKVIESRSYLIGINQDQLQAALIYTILGLVVWCGLVFVILLTSRKRD